MVGLDPFAQLAVLDLNEIADAAVGGQVGAGPELGEGAHGAAGIDAHLTQHRIQHLNPFTQAAGLDQAARTDPAAIGNRVGPPEMALGFHHHIAAEAGGLTEAAAGGIGEGDTLRHPMAAQPILQGRLTFGQLQAIVDATDLRQIFHLQMAGGAEQGDGVGEVKLTLVVVGAQFGQNGRQLLPVKAIDAGVGEVVAALFGTAVPVLNDAAHPVIPITEDAAVTRGVWKAGRQQRHRSLAVAMFGQQGLQGLGAQQGHVAVEHQQFPLEVPQGTQQLLDGVAGAVLGGLQHKFQPCMAGQAGFHPLCLVAHQQQPALGGQRFATGQHSLHQGRTGNRLQHLGKLAFHAGALSGSQHRYGEHQQGQQLGGNLLARPGPRPWPSSQAGANETNAPWESEFHLMMDC